MGLGLQRRHGCNNERRQSSGESCQGKRFGAVIVHCVKMVIVAKKIS